MEDPGRQRDYDTLPRKKTGCRSTSNRKVPKPEEGARTHLCPATFPPAITKALAQTRSSAAGGRGEESVALGRASSEQQKQQQLIKADNISNYAEAAEAAAAGGEANDPIRYHYPLCIPARQG